MFFKNTLPPGLTFCSLKRMLIYSSRAIFARLNASKNPTDEFKVKMFQFSVSEKKYVVVTKHRLINS